MFLKCSFSLEIKYIETKHQYFTHRIGNFKKIITPNISAHVGMLTLRWWELIVTFLAIYIKSLEICTVRAHTHTHTHTFSSFVRTKPGTEQGYYSQQIMGGKPMFIKELVNNKLWYNQVPTKS